MSRPPQHLRVFFDVLPDPAKSQLTLVGPEGELKLEGLHTMGENDLMVRIVGRVADGEYTATLEGRRHRRLDQRRPVEVHGEARRLRPRRPRRPDPALEALIAASARGLSAHDYTSEADRSRPRHRVGCRQPADARRYLSRGRGRRPARSLWRLELPQHAVRRRRAGRPRAVGARSGARRRAHPRLLRASGLGAAWPRHLAARRLRVGGARARVPRRRADGDTCRASGSTA